MWKRWKERCEQRRLRAEQAEVRRAFRQLQCNDRQFQLAQDPYYIEQLIYERAAILSRCRALLIPLRRREEGRR